MWLTILQKGHFYLHDLIFLQDMLSFIHCLILKNYWIRLCFTFGKKQDLLPWAWKEDLWLTCMSLSAPSDPKEPFMYVSKVSVQWQRSNRRKRKTFSSSPKVICMACQCKQGLIHFSHVITKMHVWAGNVTRWCYRARCTQRVLQMKRPEDEVHV